MTLRIGLDVGGTFTDLEAIEVETGRRVSAKVASRPGDAASAILAAVDLMLDAAGAAPADVRFVGHGTTVVTNMLIERQGAALGIVTTRGFRDVLALGRQARPDVYDYRIRRPAPLARRAHRYEVSERLAADGAVLTPLDEAGVLAIAETIHAAGLGAVAVCFLHAHRNPVHEARAAALLADALPGVYITTSHDAAREMREFERHATAAVNAFVGPRAAHYFDKLKEGLAQKGVPGAPYTITSTGALTDAESAARQPVRTALSGPAAGVMGISRILAAHQIGDLITFDVGGTSTDVAVVRNGEPGTRLAREVAGFPILAPTVDLDVVGAGGGSLARISSAGLLTVGPDSAGADPGPVAYQHGGTVPTLTDALLVLGRLGDGMRLGEALTLSRAAAERAIASQIAAPLGVSVTDAAEGVLAVAAANMARTIRSAVVQRGHALARFTLAAYGGAGPLVAADVADALGLSRVVVPVSPGTLCARAALVADLARDDATVLMHPLTASGCTALADAFAAMAERGRQWLAAEGVAAADRKIACHADVRYAGQSFELMVPSTLAAEPKLLADAFHARHEAERGFRLDSRPMEIVTARVRAFATPNLPAEPPLATTHDPPGQRNVVFAGAHHETPVVQRAALLPGSSHAGPCVILEPTATTVVPPGWALSVERDATLLLSRDRP